MTKSREDTIQVGAYNSVLAIFLGLWLYFGGGLFAIAGLFIAVAISLSSFADAMAVMWPVTTGFVIAVFGLILSAGSRELKNRMVGLGMMVAIVLAYGSLIGFILEGGAQEVIANSNLNPASNPIKALEQGGATILRNVPPWIILAIGSTIFIGGVFTMKKRLEKKKEALSNG